MSAYATDIHVHSRFSPDSEAAFEEHCERALALGIERVCFTDHVELCPTNEDYGYFRAEAYFDALERARETYRGSLTLLSGVEIAGGPHIYQKEYAEYLSLPFDFILCSVHDWYEGLFASQMIHLPMPLEESFGLYWDEVLAVTEYGGFDAFAHLDFPKRYYGRAWYDYEKLERIFKAMVEKGIALEINTSSLRKGLDETMPGPEMVELYKRCGGRYAFISSDAHRASDLGAGFDAAAGLLEGLTAVYYEERKRIRI
jgi:histidinol-phosphatase (PHP family)